MKRLLTFLFAIIAGSVMGQITPIDVTGPAFDTPNRAFTKINANEAYLDTMGVQRLDSLLDAGISDANAWKRSGTTTIAPSDSAIIYQESSNGEYVFENTMKLDSVGFYLNFKNRLPAPFNPTLAYFTIKQLNPEAPHSTDAVYEFSMFTKSGIYSSADQRLIMNPFDTHLGRLSSEGDRLGFVFNTVSGSSRLTSTTTADGFYALPAGNGGVYLGSGSDKIIGYSSDGVFINIGASDFTGDTYYRNSSGYFSRLAAAASGNVYLSGTAPSWGKVTSSHIDATVATASDLAGKQAIDTDLTAIAGLSPTNDDVIQRKSGAWANRSMSQLKTDLSLSKSDVGLGNVDNTSDVNKPISTATQTALDAKTTTALTASTGTDVAFDVPRLYGTDASPVTGNITFNSTGAITGMVQTMIHNDSSEPTFGSEFKVSGTYVTGADNLIMFLCTGSSAAWVTISQENE